MKVTISISLLAVFLFNVSGYVLLLHLHKSDIEENIFDKFDAEDMSVLYVSADDSDLIWLEKNEIQYKRRRYDVVEATEKDGRLTIHCFHDKKEEKLLSALDDHHNHHSSKTKNKTKVAAPFNLFLDDKNEFIPILLYHSQQNSSANFHQNLSLVYLEVIVPPPQI